MIGYMTKSPVPIHKMLYSRLSFKICPAAICKLLCKLLFHFCIYLTRTVETKASMDVVIPPPMRIKHIQVCASVIFSIRATPTDTSVQSLQYIEVHTYTHTYIHYNDAKTHSQILFSFELIPFLLILLILLVRFQLCKKKPCKHCLLFSY